MKHIETKTIKETQGYVREKVAEDLDAVLSEIGHFGPYQLRTFAILSLAAIFIGFSANEYLFTTARIPTRCLIPECENVEGPIEFRPSWIMNAVPNIGIGNESFDNCKRFGSYSPHNITELNDECPAILFDQNTIVSCGQYVYENQNTVVYDFDLACDEWRRTFIGSLRVLGLFVAHPLGGFISDKWGRRTALFISSFNAAWLGIVRYWASTYYGFAISEIIETIFGGGFSCCIILVNELVNSKYRVLAAILMSTIYVVGSILVGVIAWAVPYWRHLTLALYIPQLISIFYLCLISESFRWYISKGRYDEFEKVLKNAARVNGKELSENCLKNLKHTVEEKKLPKNKETWLVVTVIYHKQLLLRCMMASVWWISCKLVSRGLSVNAVNISGNMYINFCAVTAIQIPGFWTAFILTSRLGRKPVLTGAYWICACCQIAYYFMPAGNYGLSLTLYLLSKYAISMVSTLLYLYTIELYPTIYRHRLLAFNTTVGSLGSIIAPLTPAFGDKLQFIVFAACALLSGALVFLTPETNGLTLSDTLEEAERLGEKKPNSC